MNAVRKWTQEQAREYVAHPSGCPFCGGALEADDGMEPYQERDGHHYHHAEVRCQNCPAQWEDVYQLVGIAPLEDQEEV